LKQLIIGYVVGFIDAEASFSVSVKIQRDLMYGIRLDPVFSITQSNKEPLELVSKIIGAGRIIRKPGQSHLYLLIIDNMDELVGKLIPFLDKYLDLLRVKKEQYRVFRDIVLSLHKGSHKDVNVLKNLVSKAYYLSRLSSKSHRKRSLEEVIRIIDSFIARRRDLPGER
jgi:hypothetical protein